MIFVFSFMTHFYLFCAHGNLIALFIYGPIVIKQSKKQYKNWTYGADNVK